MAGRAFVSRFSPNRTDPEVLEAIFVQRHYLADTWLERLRDSILTEVKHHLLAVGPRGCGKSHLVALLVGRLRNDPALGERVRIAWLPEDETTPSFWKFLLRILRALNANYRDEFPLPPHDQLANAANDRRSSILVDYLLKQLDGRALLVVVENLDDVMRGLKAEGQKRWRAFLQEHPVTATLATAQRLTKDLSSRDRPFFNFFQIENLQSLSADEALALLQKISLHINNQPLVSFLETPTGRARVRAIRHIAGGSHRVFIILSEFVTRESLDNLVMAFEELLDELTPYYQERLRWLPDQQREIVEMLCRQTRTVTVKKIAAELFLSEQTAAAQLKSLRDKGYVTSETVGRESRYELAEPLMRLCVEVKDPQREPIRLIVEFLRVWYDRAGLEDRLQRLPGDADLERRFFQAALKAHRPGIPGPVEEALNHDLAAARETGQTEEVVQVLIELAATADTTSRCLAVASELSDLGRHSDALAACDRAITYNPESGFNWNLKGFLLNELCRFEEALVAINRAIDMKSDDSTTWQNKGYSLGKLGRFEEALASYDRAIEMQPDAATIWHCKGYVLEDLGRHDEALAAFDRTINLNLNDAFGWTGRGFVLNELGQHNEALTAYERAIEIEPNNDVAWNNIGWTLCVLGRYTDAIIALDRAIEHRPFHTAPCANRGFVKVSLGQIGAAIEDFEIAIKLDGQHTRAFEGLAEAYILQGKWKEAEGVLSERFRLRSPPFNRKDSHHLPQLITTIFGTSSDRKVWTFRVGRLAEIATEAQADWEQKRALPKEGTPPVPADTIESNSSPKSLTVLGDALVRSLTKKGYAEANAESLTAWAEVWQEVSEQHTDLSLAARLFGVGVSYLQTKDEGTLLDLVQEERSLLRDLFGLDKDSDETAMVRRQATAK